MSILILLGIFCGFAAIIECLRNCCFRNDINHDVYFDIESDTTDTDNDNPYRINT